MTLHLSESVVIRNEHIQERAVRAQGTSGNNLHHKATAVELRYDVRHAALPEEVRARVLELGGRHVTADGVLVITSRLAASQKTNRDAARGRFLSLLLRAARPVEPRKLTHPRRSVRAKRVEVKRTRGERKLLRRHAGNDD